MPRCAYCPIDDAEVRVLVDNDGNEEPTCRWCYYNGAPLNHRFAALRNVLEKATGTEWVAEHTGGGCFWIATYLPAGVLTVTPYPDVLGGGDTPTSVRNGQGWCLGATRPGRRRWREAIGYWPGESVATDAYGLSDEELPMRVIEAAQLLNAQEATT